MKRYTYIGKKGAQTLYYVAEEALRKGLPLNYCFTINFSETNILPLKIPEEFYKFKSELKRWIETPTKYHKAFIFTAVWVFENCIHGKGCHRLDSDHNVHVHLAMHIPKGYENYVFAKIKYFLEKMTVINDSTLYMKDTLRNQSLSYLIKGCHSDYIDIYGRGQKATDQGYIPWRRSGTTRNIGSKARKETDIKLNIKRSFPANYKK